MKQVFLYPGQGSQVLGMGVAAADEYPNAAAVFDLASDAAGYDMRALCAEGPIEKLSRTRYTQPAMFTVEVALTEILRDAGITPDCVAGHSLGEFAAWYAAGVYTFEDAFRLVSERGRLMDEADPEGRGAMAAVIGPDRDIVEEACTETEGVVVLANLNAPGQFIISGEKTAVEHAGDLLMARGARRVLPLKVSGAFHSPLMKGIREEFARMVADTPLDDAEIPVFANVTAQPVTDAGEIARLMVEQLTSPVRWIDIVAALVADGVERGIEVGPGNVLAGLVKRMNAFPVVNVADPVQMNEVRP
jgi:[acyl-carrier-protein] S-malonyltransferase